MQLKTIMFNEATFREIPLLSLENVNDNVIHVYTKYMVLLLDFPFQIYLFSKISMT